MSMRPVCDRCQRKIDDNNRCIMPREFPAKPGVKEGDEAYLLVSTSPRGQHMVVAGMDPGLVPEGLHTMWIEWSDKFDICEPCVAQLLYEIAKRLHDNAREPQPLKEAE